MADSSSNKRGRAAELVGKVPWLSLFYDLIVVAVISRATYIYGNNPTWLNFGFILISLIVIYSLWAITQLELLASPAETWLKRGIVLVQVIAVLIAGLAMYRGGGLSDRWGFLALAIAFASVSLLSYLRRRTPHTDSRFTRPIIVFALITALIFCVGLLFPSDKSTGDGYLSAWIVYSAGALCALIGFAIWGARMMASDLHIKATELNERFGVLLLIVLGDAFIQILEVLGTDRTIPSPLFLSQSVILVITIWMLYFPTLSNPPLPHSPWRARSRIIAHFILIAESAFSITAFVVVTDGTDGVAPSAIAQETWSALPLIGVAVAILWLTINHAGHWTRQATAHAVTIALIVGITIAGRQLNALFDQSDLIVANIVLFIDAVVVLALSGLLRPRGSRNTTAISAE